jgi:riboflavin-specific deaminase-like protein
MGKKPDHRRPFITANFAMTWDGRITTRNFTPSDFSSKADKYRLMEIRAGADAILQGRHTIEQDNFSMSIPKNMQKARLAAGKTASPLRVLVSNSGRINPNLRIFTTTTSRILVYSTSRMPAKTQQSLADSAKLNLADSDSVDLREMLHDLRQTHGVQRLVCEGGAALFRSLLAEKLVDEIHLTLCPFVFGGEKAPGLTGATGTFFSPSLPCNLAQMEVVGDECFLRYRVAA